MSTVPTKGRIISCCLLCIRGVLHVYPLLLHSPGCVEIFRRLSSHRRVLIALTQKPFVLNSYVAGILQGHSSCPAKPRGRKPCASSSTPSGASHQKRDRVFDVQLRTIMRSSTLYAQSRGLADTEIGRSLRVASSMKDVSLFVVSTSSRLWEALGACMTGDEVPSKNFTSCTPREEQYRERSRASWFRWFQALTYQVSLEQHVTAQSTRLVCIHATVVVHESER